MPITEEERKRNALQKEVIKSSTSNIEEDVAFGGNKHLFRVEGEMDKGCIYYIDNITNNEVVFAKNYSCLNLILFLTFSNGKYYDMNNPILQFFLENYSKTDGTLMKKFKSIKYTGMPNLLDNDNASSNININENKLKPTYSNNHTLSNYNSNPYQDRNNYKNNTEYKQDFYHTFSDPWKVRNDVEKNGHIVNEFGEVFSKEQIKEYKKLGHNIILDSNIHGDKSTK